MAITKNIAAHFRNIRTSTADHVRSRHPELSNDAFVQNVCIELAIPFCLFLRRKMAEVDCPGRNGSMFGSTGSLLMCPRQDWGIWCARSGLRIIVRLRDRMKIGNPPAYMLQARTKISNPSGRAANRQRRGSLWLRGVIRFSISSPTMFSGNLFCVSPDHTWIIPSLH